MVASKPKTPIRSLEFRVKESIRAEREYFRVCRKIIEDNGLGNSAVYARFQEVDEILKQLDTDDLVIFVEPPENYWVPTDKSKLTEVKKMKEIKTCRGFSYLEFQDTGGVECNIQESSACPCEDENGVVNSPNGFLWLGVKNPAPQIMKSQAKQYGLQLVPGEEVSGWMPYPIPKDVSITTHMHLDEQRVRDLIDVLQRWLKTGDLKTLEKTNE